MVGELSAGGWAGRLIGGDELLPETQRRLGSADRTVAENAKWRAPGAPAEQG